MSYLVAGNAIIHHIPKTGGMYIRKLLETNKIEYKILNGSSGFERELLGRDQELFHGIPKENEEYKKILHSQKLMIIRHPVDWYLSYWKFRESRTGTNGNRMSWSNKRSFDKCKSKFFGTFIRKVSDMYPDGFLHNLYETYYEQSFYVCKLEHLYYDLLPFLNRITGKDCIIFPEKKVNHTDNYNYEITLKDIMFIMHYERETVNRWGYEI